MRQLITTLSLDLLMGIHDLHVHVTDTKIWKLLLNTLLQMLTYIFMHLIGKECLTGSDTSLILTRDKKFVRIFRCHNEPIRCHNEPIMNL